MSILRFLAAGMMLATFFFSLAACQEIASPIEDYGWILYRYGEPGNMKDTLAHTEVTACFNSKDKTVSGNAGCNHYGGAYEVERLNLTIHGPFVVTEMYCGDDINAQETAFLDALQKAESFELERGELIIHSGKSRLYFKRAGDGFKTVNYWQE